MLISIVKPALPERAAQCAHARGAIKTISRHRGTAITAQERPKIYALAYKGYTARQIVRGFTVPATT